MFNSLFEKYDRLIFFDTETTGFDSDKAGGNERGQKRKYRQF